MAKTIDLELLELALWQAYLKYALNKPPDRPMRAPLRRDSAVVTDVLKAVRNTWRLVRSGEEAGTYHQMKRRVIDGMSKDKSWDEKTRNLYSSTISVYMTWDRGRLTITKETRQLLTQIKIIGLAIREECDGKSTTDS